MMNYRKDIKDRMKAINVRVPAVSRKAGTHIQTLYRFLNGGSTKTSTLEAILNALTKMEKDFERGRK